MNKIALVFTGVWFWIVGCIMFACFDVSAKDLDIKKYYQYNIVDFAPNDYVLLVEWSAGDFNVQNLALCKKVLFSAKLNQYLLIKIDKYSSVEFINNANVLVGPKITAIPIAELKDRVDNNSFVNK